MTVRVAWRAVLLLALAGGAGAQQIELPDPSFGREPPAGWQLSAGSGRWLSQGAPGDPGAVAVSGDGESTNYWRSGPLPLLPSAVYLLRFQACSLSGREGTPITGPVFCNRDLGALEGGWAEYRSAFATPDTVPSERSWLRFGQWHVRGEVAFDRPWLAQAQAVYAQAGDLLLGEGEQLAGGDYAFTAPLRGAGANHSRPLERFRCDFNTHRWVFGADSYVVYRHELPRRLQAAAQVVVGVNWYRGGQLVLEASVDGAAWRELGILDRVSTMTFGVPPEMLPAPAVWVRLRARAQVGVGTEADPGSFQVDTYEYRAQVRGEAAALRGSTHYVAVEQADSLLPVRVTDLGEGLPGGDDHVGFEVGNRTGETLVLRPEVRVYAEGSGDPEVYAAPAETLGAGSRRLRVPYGLAGAGTSRLEVSLGARARFRASTVLSLPWLHEARYGQVLPGSTAEVGLWWASSGWKVSRQRGLPRVQGAAIRLAAAQDETEAAQLVIRPRQPLRGLTAAAGGLSGPGGARIAAAWIEILKVGYVDLAQPSDAVGAAASWPDPLPPLRGPVDLAGGQNQPLWVRVHVPPGTPAGVYRGRILLAARDYRMEVPLEVEVYGFPLPERMTCTTAFGFSPEEVFRYQRLESATDRRAVIERYLDDFSRHRISPYDPAPLDPVAVTWTADQKPVFVWGPWDRAMETALTRYHFNSFRLSVQGLGGGTYHDRVEPELRGYREGTPEYARAFDVYARQLERHLAAKGWLGLAYVYWFDEPEPKDYDFVMNGFGKLRRAAPGIRRMLTEQPEPALFGGPDVWCPVTSAYEPQAAADRQRQGEELWWYVCTVPKAPYAGEFIDHPATEMRVWLWQTWMRAVQGVLVWQTNYWTSDAAYPDRPQNPYRDPMSWVSGYSTASGVRQAWGNGDGRFIYPPEEAADAASARPVLDGPVDSIRWEMLRDGVEDYEYFAVLRRLLAARGTGLDPALRARCESLLQVPAAVAADLTHFTRDPAPLEVHRQALARAIEELSRP